MKTEMPISFSFNITLFILIFLGSIIAISTVGFLLGQNMQVIYLAISGVIATVVISKNLNYNWKEVLRFLIIIGFIAIIGIFFSTLFVDQGWDSCSYHQPAIIALSKGWNPAYHHDISLWDYDFKNIWNTHYPKNNWIMAATFYQLFGNIEAAKIVNFLLIAGAFFISVNFFSILTTLKHYAILILSFTVAMNPVISQQMFTFYLDGNLASLLTILIFSSILYLKTNLKHYAFLSFVAAFILIGVKFTGLLYAVIIAGISLAFLYLKNQQVDRFFLKGLLAVFLFSICISGFSPYITNIVHKGHIFFPVSGPGHFDNLIKSQIGDDFYEQDRFTKLFYSIYSYASNEKEDPILKSPINFKGYDNQWAYGVHDQRIGGLGLGYGLALIMIVVIYVFIVFFKQTKNINKYVLAAAAMVIFSAFANPEMWWARLAPQLHLVPILLVVAVPWQQYLKVFSIMTLVVLVINASLTLGTSVKLNLWSTRVFYQNFYQIMDISRKNDGKLFINKSLSRIRFPIWFKEKIGFFNVTISERACTEGEEKGGKVIVWSKE
jgi:hypothetical protein